MRTRIEGRAPGAGGEISLRRRKEREQEKPAAVRTPGADEAEAAAAQSAVEERAIDKSYAPGAAVTKEPELSYQEALRRRDNGELRKAVLTDQGWVMPAEVLPRRSA